MHRPSADLTDPSRNLEESMGPTSPTSPDPTFNLDNEDDRTSTPPARIAARFYRPSTARRKDSAASSRRNSISSAHSRSSRGGDACNIGPQSKHVAQHLRRASILEDRKARLADRAAHVEKVRLRAALAKAAPRNTAASEERALAAQQARERNLAEIVAVCAEEVRRAKAVAESMKEKREQEIQKLRLQMEERMAEADRRREELRKMNAAKRGRSQSNVARKPVEVMPQVKEQESDPEPDLESEQAEISQEVAVARIECWWKASLRKRDIQAFSELGLSIDGVRETSFEKVVDLLAQEKVLTATARVLSICGLKEGESGSVNEMAAVRTFLSAFLILGHPTQVLSSKDEKGEQEQVGTVLDMPAARNDLADPQLQDLVAKARDLLICFENILSRLSEFNNYTPPPALLETLPEIYATFYNAFIAWKARDSSALIDVMILQFVELDAIWDTVKDSPEDSVTESYRKSIRDNQLMLMVRIKRLAGAEEGKKMVFKAVHQARKARAAKKPTGDTKPRITEQAVEDAGDPMIEDSPAERPDSTPAQLRTPPATPNARAQPHQAEHQHYGFQGIIPDNRVLMHELAINKEYVIDAQEYKEQASFFLKQPFQEARANIDNENREAQFRFLILMSQHIKTKLQRLVKPGHAMFNLIGEILDIEVAERQFIAGNFSYEKFFAAMSSLLPRLCAPIRDDEVKKLINEQLSQGHVVDRLEALIGFIDVMLSDYANYLLRLSAPRLLSQAANYETKHFGLALENGIHTLKEAEAAWRRARAKVHAEANKRDPEGINHPRSRPTAERVYSQVLVDTFTQVYYTPVSALPEMLRLDYKRVNKLGQQTLTIITAGAILLQCKNLLKRDVRVPWKTEATRILTVIEHEHRKQDDMVDGVMAALIGAKTMPAATKVHLRALATKMLNASAEVRSKGTEPTEPVLRLLLNRIRSHILGRLAVASASEKVKATSAAGEKLASLGLPEFVEQIREMVNEISRVGAVDRESHSMWWETVANKVEAEVGEEFAQQ